MKDKLDETGVALKVVNETVNERWEVCLTMSEKGFQQNSFVNSIATTKVSETLLLITEIRGVKNYTFDLVVYITSHRAPDCD